MAEELNKLLLEQKDAGEDIERLFRNYKKEPNARKTTDRIKSLKSDLLKVWEKFAENHNRIESIDTNGNSEYIKKKYYALISAIYSEAAAKMETDLTAALSEGSSGTGENDGKNSDLNVETVVSEVFSDRQLYSEMLRANIEKFKNFGERENEVEDLEFMLHRMERYYDSFAKAHFLVFRDSNLNNKPELSSEYDQVTDDFQCLSIQLESAISQLKLNATRTEHTNAHNSTPYFQSMLDQYLNNSKNEIRLPRIEVPKFDGEINKWPEFRELFCTMIHDNKKLNDVQRIQYLKTHVCGSAAEVIKHFQVNANNYSSAWNLLNRRYNNKKLLINNNLKRLLTQRYIREDKSNEIKTLLDTTKEIIYSLKNYGENVSAWNSIIVFIITQRLPNETLSLWEQQCGNEIEIASFEEMENFLENRFRTLETIERKQNNRPFQKSSHVRAHVSTTEDGKKCSICGKQCVSIFKCKMYKSMNVQERFARINSLKLCNICLKEHVTRDCKTNWQCHICKGKHNTSLHAETTTAANANCSSNGSGNVLLATAIINVLSPNGHVFKYRALIDQGSMSSFATEKVIQQLSCARDHDTTLISGIGGRTQKSNGSAKISFYSIYNDQRLFHTNVLILPKLTSWLPAASDDLRKEYETYELADPSFYVAGKIDIILGADVYKDILLNEVHKKSLLAQKTLLGWILSGTLREGTNSIHNSFMIVTADIDNKVSEVLQKFWETEEKVTPINNWSLEEIECEKHYVENTHRDRNGRYVCRLPFRSIKKLGRSRHIAVSNMLQLEKRFRKNPILKTKYVQCMREYIALGHAVPARAHENYFLRKQDDEIIYDCYYMPHLAVFKENSTTTKTRVVFNASSKTSNGKSLNDILMVGPVIQRDVVEKITRFRLHKYVFICDVEKMYRQIKMHKKDWDFQRFVWRENEQDDMQDYCLTTDTFGAASAPFTAIRTLKQIAIDNKQSHPVVAEILEDECYMDDIHYGNNTIEQVVAGRDELRTVLKSAGFELRKWSANRTTVLSGLPSEIIEPEDIKGFMGLLWNSSTDEFSYPCVDLGTNAKFTKRELLTSVAKIYDPLGWVQPIIITAKILMQDTWKTGLNWDDPLSDGLTEQWKICRENLQKINLVKIPRWVKFGQGKTRIELHGFSDASQKAYGAVIYLRVISKEFGICVHQMMAKSRVAPLKILTIPRLELKGALLLADLMQKVANSTNWNNTSIFAWIDSKVALCWIKSPPTKWKPFVRNRVNAIQSMIPPGRWNYVRTDENPADLVSRGCDYLTLHSSTLWFKGPSWLSTTINLEYPDLTIGDEIKEEVGLEEQRVTQCNSAMFEPNQCNDFLNKYSSFDHLCLIVSWIIRFTKKCRKIPVETATYITLPESNAARIFILTMIQSIAFKKDMADLKLNKLSKQSKIINLNPFIDSDGLLRVGGRISNASIPFDQRHPIILPDRGNYISAIVHDAHFKTLHGGKQATLGFLRRTYWILNGSRTVKSIINKCLRCHRNATNLQQQMMGQLPEPRVNVTKPFLHTGVDFCGPFQIKSKEGRGVRSFKAYISVFVCLATKAIHIEIVNSLTSESFIAALKRFVARRGTVKILYSDNGTNFVGAFRKLKRMMESLRTLHLEWKFIPPSAPHFGGLWEAGVKSIKYHLKRVLGNSIFTNEEMTTILAQIESVLNSRPLCPLTNDINDLNVLTPNHFLTGQILIPIAEDNHIGTPANLLRRWQLCTQKYQEVCHRYKTEYLHRLQQRPKWLKPSENVRVGQLFLIKDDNRKINHWALGRVIETHPGSDGLVRVVTLKTQSGQMKRPVHKLSPLPVEDAYYEQETPSRRLKFNRIYEKDTQATGAQKEIPTVRRSARIKNKTSTHLLLTILLCLGFLLLTIDSQSIHYFRHQPGVHFKEAGSVQFISKYWTLSVQQDLTETLEGIQTINESVNALEKICLDSSYNCTTYLDSLKWQQKTTTEMCKVIQGTHRVKRIAPVMIVGGVALIAGISGTTYYFQSEMTNLKEEIRELNNRQNELLKSLQAHTDLMGVASSIVHNLNNQTNTLKNGFNKAFDSVDKGTLQMDLKQRIHDVFLMSQLIMSKIEKVQNVVYALKRHQTPQFSLVSSLSLYFLDEYMRNISHLLPSEYMLPRHEIAEELLCDPSMTITQNIINIEFQIPIIHRKEYKRMTLISVPIIQENEMLWIEPNCANIAIYEKEARMIASSTECIKINTHVLCRESSPTIDNYKLNCELNLLHNSTIHDDCIIHVTTLAETWISISENEWIFVLPTQHEIQINNTTTNITGSGILTYAQNNLPKQINSSFISDKSHLIIPAVNLSRWSHHQKWHHIRFSNNIQKDITHFDESLTHIQKMNVKWDSLSTMSTFGPYAATIVSTTIVIIYVRKTIGNNKPVDHHKFFKDIV